MADLNGVYVRTAAALEEIKARKHELTREQRNLLIVADGKGELASFAKVVGCPPERLGEVAEPLVRLGLLAPAGGASQTASASAPLTVQTLIALAQQVFGDQAAPVVRKLEKAGEAPAELAAAAEAAAKLAKLTIDEAKAQTFLAEVRRLTLG